MRRQLISYIAPGAPATRRPATGDEPFLRPEIGFTPKWYRDRLGIDFGERWHVDPSYRLETILAMRNELRRRFPNSAFGSFQEGEALVDVLTGTFGACTIAGIYGIPIIYRDDNWPTTHRAPYETGGVETLEPPDLDTNPFFQSLLSQLEWIASRETRVTGFINWQGILNNAHRLRGNDLFLDLLTEPEQCRHLFDCVFTTMHDAAKRVYAVQHATGVDIGFFTVSNCLVNLVSPEIYREFLLPYDIRFAEAFGCIGIHNCAWTVDAYIDDYATVPHIAYIDMGLESDLYRAHRLLPHARRAIMYRPTELADKPLDVIRADLERIARDLGPCDIVAADIETTTPDERVIAFIEMCDTISTTASLTNT